MAAQTFLLVSFGNTNASIGVYKNNKITEKYLIPSQSFIKYSFNAWKKNIEENLQLTLHDFDLIAICSVFVPINEYIEEFLKKLNHKNAHLITNKNFDHLTKHLSAPEEVGIDIICNVTKGLEKNDNILIFDFGTCVTATFASKANGIEGVLIYPGITSTKNALLKISPVFPESLEIKYNKINYQVSTEEAINSGILLATEGIIDAYIKKAKEQFNVQTIWGTGNDLALLNAFKRKFTSYKSSLGLEGLILIATKNQLVNK